MRNTILVCLVFGAGLLVAISVGCGITKAAQLKQDVPDPGAIDCDDEQDCAVRWGRAVAWIQQNCSWKTKTQTDITLETEGPLNTPQIAYQLSKIPMGGGRFQIAIRADCGPFYPCEEHPNHAKQRWYDFVMLVPRSKKAQ